uniref:Uncharacterized protein n=1 Tax=Pseudomonas phage RVTF4 TaxID=3236931 RepID=A0AB39CCW7_9VIRU
MIEAIKEMGPIGKIVLGLMVVGTVKSCARHIQETARLRKEQKK